MSTRERVLQRVRDLRARRFHPSRLTDGDRFLLERLTTLHDYRTTYSGTPRGELFIHWFYRDRTQDRLSRCEIFHLNMLQYFNVMDRVEKIHIRCATERGETRAMEQAVEILSSGSATLDFQVVKPKRSWEHDTFKECVEYAVSSGKFVYYTHFKGASRMADNPLGMSQRSCRGSSDLDIAYWCYLMYRGMFEAPDNVKAIGPLPYSGINNAYRDKDISWSRITDKSRAYFYCGSFQAFSGEYLAQCLSELHNPDLNVRLWSYRNPYTVEMFLSLVALRKDVYSLDIPYTATHGIYACYTKHRIPQYEAAFKKLFAGICVANWSYKNIGGTETFNYALATALKQLGFSVCYYSPKMGVDGITEKELVAAGITPYRGEPLLCCFANQNVGVHFLGKCPVIQTCHSAIIGPEQPIRNMNAYVSITEEVSEHLDKLGYKSVQIRNGVDLERFNSRKPLHAIPRVLSICQGDDALLREACETLGWAFKPVPKEVGSRVWHIEDLINDADLVVGIGRSLYDAMACGRACVSWDNRPLNPYTGCGYVTAERWHDYARTNFTGRGYPKIDTVDGLVEELRKYRPADGATMRGFAERELDMHRNVLKYLELAGIEIRKK